MPTPALTAADRAAVRTLWVCRVLFHVPEAEQEAIGLPDSMAIDLDADIITVITDQAAVVMASGAGVSIAVEIGSLVSWTRWCAGRCVGSELLDSLPDPD
jgi:hypothetical protein